jgi:hypothetical protein
MLEECAVCPTRGEVIRLSPDERAVIEATFECDYPVDTAVCPDCLEGIRKALLRPHEPG